MDLITKSPGLFNIVEAIFIHLDYEKLLECEQVNGNWKEILTTRPWFWFKKCVQDGLLSQQDQDEWSTYMSIFKDSNHFENQPTVGLNTFVETKSLFSVKHLKHFHLPT